ncbi:MAG: putative S-adenosylmethionine-dependent methyltransferase [Syntrophorhabdus sp. PtaU1.Bin058]|nr:MAG: putative S-adenosylmethionine-dependent methyltransferase [Syntrophorhabdus sp. PtaU1.Bin058]
MTELKSYALSGTRELILHYMEKNGKGIVLDIPSGQGAFSKDLEDVGFTVFLGDLEVNNILYRNNRVTQIDLNADLPFRNGNFDYVVCIEGVEHIENPHHLVRECARLLKDNGCLIVTTPNVMTVKSRLRFLFCSYLDYFRYFGPIKGESRFVLEEYDHQHINPVFYGEMKHILTKYGLSLEKVETNKKVKKGRLTHPLIKSVIKYKTKKRFPKDPFYISDTMLDGEDLIFIARKNPSGSLNSK